jgi:hypothetical protein
MTLLATASMFYQGGAQFGCSRNSLRWSIPRVKSACGFLGKIGIRFLKNERNAVHNLKIRSRQNALLMGGNMSDG